MPRYQERQPVYTAEQYTGDNAPAIKAWADAYDPALGAAFRVDDDGRLGIYSDGTASWFTPDAGMWIVLCNEPGLLVPPIQLREPDYFTARFSAIAE